jgi:hypothetical protein
MTRGKGFDEFWKKYLASHECKILFILGLGFDPRMCEAIQTIINAGGKGTRNCRMLEYDEGPDSPSYKHKGLVKKNRETLTNLMEESGYGKPDVHHIRTLSGENRRIGSRKVAHMFNSLDELSTYTDIIVDISAMPHMIYLPLIHRLILLICGHKELSEGFNAPNLHVIVSENYVLDNHIHNEGMDENADYIYTFGAIDLEGIKNLPKIWIPILGERQEDQLYKIRDFIVPDEICPLLPFPSLDPRRGDNLIKEYGRFLFDELRIEPGNIIYADEQNPFQVYNKISKTILQYNRSLKVLEGCKVVISALSSKLLSIGALLAAYEAKRMGMRVGIAQVGTKGYHINDDIEEILKNQRSELFELWLLGDCYEV